MSAPCDIRLEDGVPGGGHCLASIAFPGGGEDEKDAVATGLKPLDGDRRRENWYARKPVRRGRNEILHYACNDEVLFGHARLAADGELAAQTLAAYRLLGDTLEEHGMSPIRSWHYLPDLCGGAPSRYRQFCDGRARALAEWSARVRSGGPSGEAARGLSRGQAGGVLREASRGPSGEAVRGLSRGPSGEAARGRAPRQSNYCAATVIGTGAGDGVFYFLAAREGGIGVENPRQVSAYRYPPRYGDPPPAFVRATLKRWPQTCQLLVSGTAAIVGHESAHPGDVAAQFGEIVRNLDALIGEAARGEAALRGAGANDLVCCKVYLNPRADERELLDAVRAHLGEGFPFRLFRGEMCRPELLVEAEGLIERGRDA